MRLHATEAGEGAPVVLLHGLFGAARNFGTLQRRLARRFRVLALDLRNHGDSPHAEAMSYEAMADDVAETLEGLDVSAAAVIGHSMGGKVAMRLALTRPDRVTRLVVADIAPVRYQSAFHPMIEAMRAIPLTPDLSRAVAEAALTTVAPDPGTRAFLLQNLRFAPRSAWRIGLDAIAEGLTEIEAWPDVGGERYPGPALFIGGARSDYILPEHRPAIRALFPASRFATLKDAGHWLHADNPDGFAAVLEGFLAA